jgi:hypothetical protein
METARDVVRGVSQVSRHDAQGRFGVIAISNELGLLVIQLLKTLLQRRQSNVGAGGLLGARRFDSIDRLLTKHEP